VVRRVVTANDALGRSVIASDEVLDPVVLDTQPGSQFRLVWGSDRPARLPSDGTPPRSSWIPPAGGFRFGLSVLPPDAGTVPADPAAMSDRLDEVRAKLPGLAEALEPDHPGMHTTDTVDIVFIVDGEVECELDEGERVTLRAGDCLVQNGTRHAWRNTSDAPCTLAITMIGVPRDDPTAAPGLRRDP
jgi:mannose-6-phosphate isomerase-like protein (cupin superfamily)